MKRLFLALTFFLLALFILDYFEILKLRNKKTIEIKQEETPKDSLKTPLKTEIEKRIDQESFSGVYLVGKEKKTLLTGSNGFKNRNNSTKNALNTAFPIGSITKLFTAAAILKLEEEGLIDLKQEVITYFKPVKEAFPETSLNYLNSITIHDLLNHSSGIEDYTKISNFPKFNLEAHTTDDILQLLSDYPTKFKAGSQYDYSDSNYLILSKLIEIVTGKSWADYLEYTFFKPLNLNSTFIPKSHFLSEVLSDHPNVATGYIQSSQNHEKIFTEANDINFSTLQGDAAIISTVENLHDWIIALFDGKVISENSLKKLTTPYFETRNKGISSGFGIFITKDEQNQTLYVSLGELEGYQAILVYEPKNQGIVVILSNFANSKIEELAKDLLGLLKKHQSD